MAKQRYSATKVYDFLNETTLEYDEARWCVVDGTLILAECDTEKDARKIVWALNFADKVAIAVNKQP